MSQSLATVAYLGAAILFILSLGGLSNPETSRRGNLFGMVGMALAVLATVFGPRVSPAGVAGTLISRLSRPTAVFRRRPALTVAFASWASAGETSRLT